MLGKSKQSRNFLSRKTPQIRQSDEEEWYLSSSEKLIHEERLQIFLVALDSATCGQCMAFHVERGSLFNVDAQYPSLKGGLARQNCTSKYLDSSCAHTSLPWILQILHPGARLQIQPCLRASQPKMRQQRTCSKPKQSAS